jgi:hypothetical protein
MEGGDRVDADGIPLTIQTQWQKALFSGPVCDLQPRITFARIGFQGF